MNDCVISEKFREVWPTIRVIDGWLPKSDSACLFSAVLSVENIEGVLVEIGSFKGRSAACMALASKSDIYCIDPFIDCTLKDGSVVELNVDYLLTNIHKLGVEARVNPLICTSERARPRWDLEIKKPIKLLFIDGNHDYEFVKQDHELWSPLVVPGGVVLFHDYSPGWPGVCKFVDELTDKEIHKFGDIAWYTKK